MSEELFEKYLRNELGDTERRELGAILRSEGGRRAFADFVQDWSLLADVSRQVARQAGEAGQSTSRLRLTRLSVPRKSLWGWWAAALAASVLFMLGLMGGTRAPVRKEPAAARGPLVAPVERPSESRELAQDPPLGNPHEAPAEAPRRETPPLRPIEPVPPLQGKGDPVPRELAPPAPPPVPVPAPPAPATPKTQPTAEKPQIPALALLERVEGSVFVVGAEGGREAAGTGLKLTLNQGVETSAPSARATIRYSDGTRLELGPDSVIGRLGERRSPGQADGAKAVWLTRGSLQAWVAKQPGERPMAIQTPHAEATVLGTQLALAVLPEATRLQVREGRVRFTRRPEGGSVEVTSNHFAVAAKGVRLESRLLAPEDSREFQDGVSPTPAYSGTRDTEISEAEPDRNFGAADIIKMDGDDGAGKKLYVLLKWDLSEIPPAIIVREVVLTLHITDITLGTGYYLYECKRRWVESEVTWKLWAAGQPWKPAGGQSNQDRGKEALGLITAHELGEHSILLNPAGQALVQSWIRNPASNNGFMIANDANSDGVKICTREFSKPEQRPKLTVKFTSGASK